MPPLSQGKRAHPRQNARKEEITQDMDLMKEVRIRGNTRRRTSRSGAKRTERDEGRQIEIT